MASIDESLSTLMSVEGALGVALVDFESGMTLGTDGGGPTLDLEVAAAGNTEIVRSKLKVMKQVGLDDRIEDILITLGSQYHLIRPLESAPTLFLYLALDRERSNLALARHRLSSVEASLEI